MATLPLFYPPRPGPQMPAESSGGGARPAPVPFAGSSDPLPEAVTRYGRAKAAYPTVVWLAVLASVGVHWTVLRYAPSFTTVTEEWATSDLQVVELAPPEVEIPPAPERIARPAMPVVSERVIAEDITIGTTTFEDFRPAPMPVLAPPPPVKTEEVVVESPSFTPYTIAPSLRNAEEAAQAILDKYPRSMRAAGLGGTVLLWFQIDEQGRVLRTQVAESSGYEALDRAAADVSHVLSFTPAYNRDQAVKVWVQLPIQFTVRDR